jgi:cell division protein FtsI/penicillin-binding protein 2
MIYDRNGEVVVDNVVASSLYAYPTNRRELGKVAAYVEDLFGMRRGSAVATYGLRPGRFRWIRRHLGDELAERIAETAPPGLHLRRESERSYPFGLIGKQIVGFTDIDNAGQAGIELCYDSLLTGKPGQADVRRSGTAQTYRVKEQALIKPEPGQSLVLTVDWRLQEIVEQEIKAAVLEHNAKAAQAVFVDCHNGDILAVAYFDPKERCPDKPMRLRPVTDQFEPGSIFKAITAAGLLEAELIDWDDTVHCENGYWQMGRNRLRDDKKHEWLAFRRVMELSSNIGTAKFALRLGGEQLHETARRFGMGQKIRLGMPGEARGRLAYPSRWSDYNVAALAMGHSVAVSSLQMAMAFAAIANGGELLRPSLLLGHVNSDGFVREFDRRELIATVMHRESADSLRSILRGVVDSGTATPVNSPVVSIAGKTGTAEIPDTENGGYRKNAFIGSFAGFFPADRPMIAGLVMLEEPHPVHYGGWTAGPAFRKIAERYTALHPDLFSVPERSLARGDFDFDNTVEVPDLVGRHIDQARNLAEARGLVLVTNADDGHITWQYPSADRLAFSGDKLLVTVSARNENDNPGMVDLTGLSVRQATALLTEMGLGCRITGAGRVVRQSIRPGREVKSGTVCRLECRPG